MWLLASRLGTWVNRERGAIRGPSIDTAATDRKRRSRLRTTGRGRAARIRAGCAVPLERGVAARRRSGRRHMARMPVRRGLRPRPPWQAGGGPCGPCGGCPSGAGRHPCDAERVALQATACGETCRWLSPSGSNPAHRAGAGAWRGLARGVRDGNDWLRRSPRRRPGLPITSSPANRPEAHIRTRAQEPKILEILIPSN